MEEFILGRIYKIVCNSTGKCYIGSTIKPIKHRLNIHKCHYKKYLEGDHNFLTSFEIIKNGNYQILLLDEVKCESFKDLYEKERYYIEKLECVNKNIPNRNQNEIKEYQKQWRENHKDEMREYLKEWRENHKDDMREYFKNYYNTNKEKLSQYYQQNKEKFSQYYQQNKDKIREYKKEYANKNKDKIREYQANYRELKKMI
jgi:hypothetical protein